MSKFIFTSNASYIANINGVMTPIKNFTKGNIITGTPVYNQNGTLNSVSYVVKGLPSSIPDINKRIRISAIYVKPYINIKDISNKTSMEYSNVNGDNNNSLLKYSIIGLVYIGAIYGLSKLIK